MDTFCPEFDIGINNLYSPEGAKKLFQTIQNDETQFLKWTERRMGFTEYGSTKGVDIIKGMKIENPQIPNSKYMCFNSHMLTADY